MRLLDRYLIREFLVPFGYCLSGFLIFWISFDLIAEIDNFQDARLSVGEIAQYYLFKMPDMLVLVLPVALLLALLYSLTDHSRHNELIAMRAAGIGLWRLSAPYFLIGLLFSIVLFTMNEFLAPTGLEAAEVLLRRHQRNPALASREWQRNLVFRNDRENRDWHIAAYNVKTAAMVSPMIAWRKPDGSRIEVFAQRGAWTNDVWAFYDVQTHLYPAPPPTSPMLGKTNDFISSPLMVKTNELVLPDLNETPEQIKSEVKISSLSQLAASRRIQLSLFDILNYKRLHPDLNPRNRALIETQLQGRLAAPWTSLVVAIIAIPFGAQAGRRNVYVGIASSISLCFAYFVLMRLGIALGTGGYLSPWLAAWLPNLLFATAGAVLINRIS